MERLQLLIFSQDSSLVGLVRAALRDLGVAGCYFDTDSTRALEVREAAILMESSDCNDLTFAREILARIRRDPRTGKTPVIAMLNDAKDMRAIQDSGAETSLSASRSLRQRSRPIWTRRRCQQRDIGATSAMP